MLLLGISPALNTLPLGTSIRGIRPRVTARNHYTRHTLHNVTEHFNTMPTLTLFPQGISLRCTRFTTLLVAMMTRGPRSHRCDLTSYYEARAQNVTTGNLTTSPALTPSPLGILTQGTRSQRYNIKSYYEAHAYNVTAGNLIMRHTLNVTTGNPNAKHALHNATAGNLNARPTLTTLLQGIWTQSTRLRCHCWESYCEPHAWQRCHKESSTISPSFM